MTAGIVSSQMARAATEHLLELGHTTVHHLAGPQRWYSARDRLDGWREALAAHGRAEPPPPRETGRPPPATRPAVNFSPTPV